MPNLLIVAVPGLGPRREPWLVMERELNKHHVFAHNNVKWIYFDHRITAMSRRSLQFFARDLEAKISEECSGPNRWDEIVFTGHSLGALVARKAWLNAVDRRQGNDYTNADWGEKVSRFVLFAGISRGLETETPLPRRLLTRFVEALPGRFTIEDCYRGSAFITNLRISWIQHISSLDINRQPITVQLLGTKDGVVKREDSIDLDAFPDAVPINISGAGHGDLHLLEGVDNRQGRLDRFIDAFKKGRDNGEVERSDAYRERRVLMVVHGIRASRTDDWMSRAITTANQRWPDVVAINPGYGYLSALRFVLPTVRRTWKDTLAGVSVTAGPPPPGRPKA